MADTLLRVVQVGAGGAGIRRLHGVLEHPHAALAAVVEPDPECRRRIQSELPDSTPVYASLADAFGAGPVDAVILSTPHADHARLTIEALERDAHVLCEKPLGRSSAEVRLCLEAARAHDRRLQVGANHVAFPSVLEIERLTREATLGELRSVVVEVGHDRLRKLPAWFRDAELSGGGTFKDNGFHTLLLAHRLLGAVEDRLVSGSAEFDWLDETRRIEVAARVQLRSAHGRRVELRNSWVGEPKGFTLHTTYAGGSAISQGPEDLRVRRDAGEEERLSLPATDPEYSWRADTFAFLDGILGGVPPTVGGPEALFFASVVERLRQDPGREQDLTGSER
jgi:predicted dehydrogenase